MSVEESRQELERGDEAPDFELPATDGTTYALDDFMDFDALLVVFTCNHCPYAEAKVDEMKRLDQEYEDLAVVGINPNDADDYPEDSFEKMQEFVEERGIQYTYLRDESQEVAEAYGAVCTPDPFLFRREGEGFVLAYHGRFDDSLNPDDEPTTFHMEQAVEQVLAGEEVDLEFLPSRGCSIKWRD
ncbi:MAG: thioredoxin family protein [Candidatus Nanohaloarchaea archaeon]|nr:thioredoxin family protein [Candidatus Nanohaloarchaea archaeon]